MPPTRALFACLLALLAAATLLHAQTPPAEDAPIADDPALGRLLQPSVLLPDGRPFRTWEPEGGPTWTRDYHVAPTHPAASDAGPGSAEQPFRSIAAATAVLQPGERVLIAPGLYREAIEPPRGGTGPDAMIGYHAAGAPGSVVISGAAPLDLDWQPAASYYPGPAAAPDAGAQAWADRLPDSAFPHGNPFALSQGQAFAIDRVLRQAGDDPAVGNAEALRANLLPRGQVWVSPADVAYRPELTRLAKTATQLEFYAHAPGVYWYDDAGRSLLVRLPLGLNPADLRAPLTLTTHQYLFRPSARSLGYIHLRGITFRDAGNAVPAMTQAMVSTESGHHWLIEDCTFDRANGTALDLGRGSYLRHRESPAAGRHIVRRCRFRENGMNAIGGYGHPHFRSFGLLIEDCLFVDNGWQPDHGTATQGVLRLHFAVDCLIRRNTFSGSTFGSAIWLDNSNGNTRICQNVITGIHDRFGAIFLELSSRTNLVDRNILVHNACAGIYEHDTENNLYLHNLIADANPPLKLRGSLGKRFHQGQLLKGGGNSVLGNLIAAPAGADIATCIVWSPRHHALPNRLDVNPLLPLRVGWQDSLNDEGDGSRDALDRLLKITLTLPSDSAVPTLPRHPLLTHDFFDQPYAGDLIPAGPYADPAAIDGREIVYHAVVTAGAPAPDSQP